MASEAFDPETIAANIKASEDCFDRWYEESSGSKTTRAIQAEEITSLRAALATAEAEGYRRGVEDAAKVADEAGKPYALQTQTGAMMFRACTEKIADAIRYLTADKEGA